MNPDADVTYQTFNLFSSGKCCIYFIFDVPHYIRSNQPSTICIILVKVDVLDTCGAMILTLESHSAIFYEDRKYCLYIFLKQHALVH